MKKAIKIVESRITALKSLLSPEESNNTFHLTNMDIFVKVQELEFVLSKLNEEYDKTRNKRKVNNNPNASGS